MLDAAGNLLADFGGPYVIAPVSGTLKDDGRVIGSYVLSVQDDAGVVKLAHDFIGDDAGIYGSGSLIVGSPARAVRALDDVAVSMIAGGADIYVRNHRRYAKGLKPIG